MHAGAHTCLSDGMCGGGCSTWKDWTCTHLNCLAQAAFADAAQAGQGEAVSGDQQVLRHGHPQAGSL